MDLISHLVFVCASDSENSKIALDLPLSIFLLAIHLSLDHISQPQELRHKGGLWPGPHFCWRACTDDLTVVQDQNSICNCEGFLLIVSDIDGGNICLTQNGAQLV